jgi:AcrR family transcriptional regulator
MPKPLRSQVTRDRILTEARRLFAAHGFEQTTIRAVAAAAEINPAMVIRYYGNKEDLFLSASRVDFHMPDLSAVAADVRGEALVAHVLDVWDAGDELPALLRAAATHDAARARIVEAVEGQAVAAISAVLRGSHKTDRLALIVMQITGLVFSRYVLKHPAVMAVNRASLIRHVGAAVQALLMQTLPADMAKSRTE